MRNVLIIIIFLLAFFINLDAQNASHKFMHSLSFKSQFHQVKDEFNYGLVNNGLNLMGEYSLEIKSEKGIFQYDTDIGFGMNYRQGLGMIWSFKPIDIYYGWSLKNNKDISIALGPYLETSYKWQLYPELQSGHMFWNSSFELGSEILISLPVKKNILHFSFSNSLASVHSRPEIRTEEYFYSLTFSDFIKNPHSNMKAGLQKYYSHINLKILKECPGKKMSIGYEFDFIDYTEAPAFKYISHSLNLKWKLGKDLESNEN